MLVISTSTTPLAFALIYTVRLEGSPSTFGDDYFGLRPRRYSLTRGARRLPSPKTHIIIKIEVNNYLEYHHHVCVLFSICFVPLNFRMEFLISEAYERAVMGTILMAKVIDSVVPLPMYSATMLCCTIQTKVVERLLLREWPSPYVNGPHVTTQGTICKFCTHQKTGGKLPPPSLPVNIADLSLVLFGCLRYSLYCLVESFFQQSAPSPTTVLFAPLTPSCQPSAASRRVIEGKTCGFT